MAHQGQATHRRHPQPPSPSMDHHHPLHRQPSKSKPKPKPIHPVPDPPPTTIQSISHRFSKLYANHKKLIVSKPSQDSSQCTSLTKSSSHHERNHHTRTHAESIAKPHMTRRECAKNLIPKTVEIEDEGPEKGIPKVQLGMGVRRKSFCSSQSELADFLFCTGVKVVAVDMPPFMQVHAVDCARKTLDSLEKFTSKTLAFTLKKEFDGVYGPAWHCIVGTSFGSFVTHSVGGFMYFSVDQKLYVLLFKTTVQRADQ